jgi:transposase InsO family protein
MTAAEIAEVLGLPLSTVSLWLKRIGLGKRSRLDPLEPPNRYERPHPGELVHLDIKKLGRISALGAGHRVTGVRNSQHARTIAGRKMPLTGYEYLHVVVDDYSRLAYAEVLDDLTAACAIAFLRRAIAWYAARGVSVKAVMTDNGSCYIAHDYQRALRSHRLKHLRIRPGRPRTNGKAERLIQTLLTEWAYARIYGSSNERAAALPAYLDRYNHRRPHGSHQPPATRFTAEQPPWELHLVDPPSSSYCRDIAMCRRSSGVIRWSRSSAALSMSICTQRTRPVKTLSFEP